MATFYVGTGNNDGYKQAGGSWGYTENDVINGIIFGSAYTSVLRFSSVNIPQGSTINSATLKGYTSSSSLSGTVRMKVYGIDEDDTATLTSDPTGRTKTTAVVDWDISVNPGTASHTSPSIVAVLQEIVDRGGWSSGNSLGFIIVDDSSDSDKRQFWYSYEGDSTKDFELTTTWTAPASTTTTSTSTSTSTTTSTSSSSTTTSFWVPSSNHKVVLVTKDGKNIYSDSLDDFYLHSEYPLLKVQSYGSFSTSTIGKATITHNLGYKPYVIVFSEYVDDNAGSPEISTEYYQHDWEIEGATITFFGRTKIYDNEIQIEVGNTNAATPGVVDGFYYIFSQEV